MYHMKLPNAYTKTLASIAASLCLLTGMGCGSSTESGNTGAPARDSHTLGGVGAASDEAGTCTVKQEYEAISNLGWKGYENKRFFKLEPSKHDMSPSQSEEGDSLEYTYKFGDCHAVAVNCNDLQPACKCRLDLNDNGMEVIRVKFAKPTDAADLQIDGGLILVLDEGGGGGGR